MANWNEVRSRCGLRVKGKTPTDHQCEMMGLIVTETRKREPGANEETIAGAVATAIQESECQNIKHGDKDSLGLYQQRPSMGWGTPAQITEPKYAIKKFLDLYLPYRKQGFGWLDASHKTQRSAHPSAPKQWYDEGVKAARCWGGQAKPPAPPASGGSGQQPPPLRVDWFGEGHNSRHADVRVWQQKMRERKWAIDVDGSFGPQSAGIARQFQRNKRLTVDGKVGKQTWNATWTTPVG